MATAVYPVTMEPQPQDTTEIHYDHISHMTQKDNDYLATIWSCQSGDTLCGNVSLSWVNKMPDDSRMHLSSYIRFLPMLYMIVGCLWTAVAFLWVGNTLYGRMRCRANFPRKMHLVLSIVATLKLSCCLLGLIFWIYASRGEASLSVGLLLGFQVSVLLFKAAILSALALAAKGYCLARTALTTTEYACLFPLTLLLSFADVYSDGVENTAILACYVLYAVYIEYLFRNVMHLLQVLGSYIGELHQQALRRAEGWTGEMGGGGGGGAPDDDLSSIEKLSLAYRKKHQVGRKICLIVILASATIIVIQSLRFYLFASFMPFITMILQEVWYLGVFLGLGYQFRYQDETSYIIYL